MLYRNSDGIMTPDKIRKYFKTNHLVPIWQQILDVRLMLGTQYLLFSPGPCMYCSLSQPFKFMLQASKYSANIRPSWCVRHTPKQNIHIHKRPHFCYGLIFVLQKFERTHSIYMLFAITISCVKLSCLIFNHHPGILKKHLWSGSTTIFKWEEDKIIICLALWLS
jgi:hypothetical protein